MQLDKILSTRSHCNSKYLFSLNKQTEEKEKISSFAHTRLDKEHLQDNPWNCSYAKHVLNLWLV